MTAGDLAGSLRIRQWTKNVLLFAALVFSKHADRTGDLMLAAAGFLLFSLAAGAVYLVNDIIDIERDRRHPVKRDRPLAAGRMSTGFAWTFAAVLLVVSLPAAFVLDCQFGIVLSIYLAMQVLYSTVFKNVVILDVFIVSAGFLLRVIAGGVIIDVEISSWILVCTMLLALFLALSKRRHEITLLDSAAFEHRIILSEYTPYLLDQMIGIVTSSTLVAYTIFTLSETTVEKFGRGMIYTVPFVLYGIFRYLYLVHRKNAGGRPEETLLTDLPLQFAIVVYGVVSLIVIYL